MFTLGQHPHPVMCLNEMADPRRSNSSSPKIKLGFRSAQDTNGGTRSTTQSTSFAERPLLQSSWGNFYEEGRTAIYNTQPPHFLNFLDASTQRTLKDHNEVRAPAKRGTMTQDGMHADAIFCLQAPPWFSIDTALILIVGIVVNRHDSVEHSAVTVESNIDDNSGPVAIIGGRTSNLARRIPGFQFKSMRRSTTP